MSYILYSLGCSSSLSLSSVVSFCAKEASAADKIAFSANRGGALAIFCIQDSVTASTCRSNPQAMSTMTESCCFPWTDADLIYWMDSFKLIDSISHEREVIKTIFIYRLDPRSEPRSVLGVWGKTWSMFQVTLKKYYSPSLYRDNKIKRHRANAGESF